MKLVIVESPNKTRKLREFLGQDYRIAASFGHVRDLPAAGDLAVAFVEGRVQPRYVTLERAERAIGDLKRLAAQADEVLLATDPDREGEAIAWHLSQVLGPRSYRRVVFNAVTRQAVQQAVANPRAIDERLVDAQQARRVLDRVVGWSVSPTLKRVGKEARSAGRVQSAALRLVAEREREIGKFKAVDYFLLVAELERPGTPPPFKARLAVWKGEPLAQRLTDKGIAEQTVAWCRRQRSEVTACDRREQMRHPPPPFTTATVQQAASLRLKLAPEQTMNLLQELFEDGAITYHRTDSTALAPEAVQAARAIIADRYPKAYLPERPVAHATKAANAQEAHEAIRPTHPEGGPDALGEGDAGQKAKLYALIWKRFVACQMASGRDQFTVIDVACAPGTWRGPRGDQAPQPMGVFRAKGTVVLFDGWRRLGGDATEETPGAKPAKPGRTGKAPSPRAKGKPADADEDDDAGELPMLQPGDALDLKDLQAVSRSTKPPPRWTQASLIKKLDHDGIGRPSTYQAIMRTLFDRGYVVEQQRKLHATPLGMAVTDFLVRHFAGDFIDLAYTARMEEDLDRIARGETPWEAVVTRASRAVVDLARRAGLWYDPLAGDGGATSPRRSS